MKNKFWIGVLVILVVLTALIAYLKFYYFVPDLVLDDASFTPQNPIVNVDTVTLGAKVENVGKANAVSFDMCLFNNGKLVDSKVIDGLDKEKSADISFNYKFSTIGHQTVDLVVDCKVKVREKNKANNQVTFGIEVKEAPPSEITVTPSQEPASITTTVFKKKLGKSWYSSQFAGSAPVIYDGKIYVGGKNQYFFCLDKDTGDEIWKYEVTDAGLIPGIYSTPIFYKGNVYFGSTGTNLIESRGHVFSLNAKDGSLVWKYDTDADVSSLSLDNGEIGARALDGSTYIIDALTGKLVKKYASLIVADKGKIYILDGATLSCIDSVTGNILWTFKEEEHIGSIPIVYDGKVYLDGRYCLDAEKGFLIWENKEVERGYQALDGNLLFVTGDKQLFCIDVANRQTKWKRTIGLSIAPPFIFNGRVYVAIYVGTAEKKVYCIQEYSGNIIAIYGTGEVITTRPLVYEGRIYVIAEDGYFYCFKEK